MSWSKILPIVILLVVPVSSQLAYQPTMVFLGASNTNTEQWNNGSYVTKLSDIGHPWTDMDLSISAFDGAGAFTYYQNITLLEDHLLNFEPEIMLIMLGGNDFLQQYPVDEFTKMFDWILDKVSERSKATVFVTNIIWSPLEFFLPSGVIAKFDAFQHSIKNTTESYDYHLVDVYNATVDQVGYFQTDFIHLNEEGHKAVAAAIDNQTREIIEQAIQPYLGPDRTTGILIGIGGMVFLIALIPLLRRYLKSSQ